MGKWAPEAYAGCAKELYATEEPGKVQGRDPVGIVEGSYGYRARGVSIRGKFGSSRNLGYKMRGLLKLALWLNVVLTPGYPTPTSKFRYGI